MRRGEGIVGIALTLLLAAAAHAENQASLEGHWWAEGGSAQVEIHGCGDELCGTIAWLRSPFDEHGCPMRDRENPARKLRDRDLIGLRILSGLRPTGNGAWTGGRIYDPAGGRTYSATLYVDDANRVRLRGYIGFELLGRTTTWIRVGYEGQCDPSAS